MWETQGYRISAELVLNHWHVIVRARVLNESLEPHWYDVLDIDTERDGAEDIETELAWLLGKVIRRLER